MSESEGNNVDVNGTTDEDMKVFLEIYDGLPRQGPGDEASTLKALGMVPDLPAAPSVADVGCGSGAQTLVLARNLGGGTITAVDLHKPHLKSLKAAAKKLKTGVNVVTSCQDMRKLDFEEGSLDLIWAEGSIYNIGFGEGALKWRSLLKDGGYLAASELSWLRDDPPDDLKDYWAGEYPGMKSVEENLEGLEGAGYDVVGHFTIPDSCWLEEFYDPMEKRLADLEQKYAGDGKAQEVLAMNRREIEIFRKYSEYYGYVFYIARKV